MDATDMEGKTTVRDVGTRWLSDYVATRRNEKGQRIAEARFQAYLVPSLGSLGVEDVKPEDLRQLRLKLEGHGLSPQTVAHILSDARCLFRYAADELRLIPRSPFPPRLLPRIQETVPRRHTEQEITIILDSVTEDYAFVISLALSTGLRWGEIQRLKWRHVDWGNGQLVVEHTKSARVRRVPLSEAIQATLKARFSHSNSHFISPFKCDSSGSFNRSVRKMSGVTSFSFHRLRHAFACDWLEAGGSKEALQLVLGHSTIRLTERYGKVSDGFVQLEAKRVAAGVAAKYCRVTNGPTGERQHGVT